jgi:hypothetical protein
VNWPAFHQRLDDNQSQIFEQLHTQFMAFPEVSCKLRYKIPFYYYISWVCYINPVKNSGIELCFLKGKQLSQNGSLLDDRGRKMVAGVYIHTIEKLNDERIIDCFSEDLILDEETKR